MELKSETGATINGRVNSLNRTFMELKYQMRKLS